MQIIIPLSGSGLRFQQAGYKEIKPLIPVQGKPMIEWVTRLFPGVHDFIFIAREDHLRNTKLESVLTSLAPYGRTIAIAPHRLGPVHALQQAAGKLDLNSRTIVSYCDYFMHWDYAAFTRMVMQTHCQGAIPCYTGFHPHLLHEKNIYAGCRVGSDNRLLEIKEKHSFTNDKTNGHHSVGMYYFQTGALMLQYCDELVSRGHSLNGEYYVSMVYEAMLRDGLDIRVYDQIPHFCQWGTPADLEEYLWWQQVFQSASPHPSNSTL
jgi:NDP-sugar pyrophosphorylase family protein